MSDNYLQENVCESCCWQWSLVNHGFITTWCLNYTLVCGHATPVWGLLYINKGDKRRKHSEFNWKTYYWKCVHRKLMFFFPSDSYKVSTFSHYDWPSVSVQGALIEVSGSTRVIVQPWTQSSNETAFFYLTEKGSISNGQSTENWRILSLLEAHKFHKKRLMNSREAVKMRDLDLRVAADFSPIITPRLC